MPHTYTQLLVHITFGTKHRRPWIKDDFRPRLHGYMSGIVRELGGRILAVNGTADHVHLLLALPPSVAVADAMRVVKTNSSRWIHEEFPEMRGFCWQAGYAAFSVSQSNLDTVRGYIQGQREHHRKTTFQKEYIAFLRKRGIEFDIEHVRDSTSSGVSSRRPESRVAE